MNQLRHKYKIETSFKESSIQSTTVRTIIIDCLRKIVSVKVQTEMLGHVSFQILNQLWYEAERTPAVHSQRPSRIGSADRFISGIQTCSIRLFLESVKSTTSFQTNGILKPMFRIKITIEYWKRSIRKFVKLSIAWQYQFGFKRRLCKYSERWFYWCRLQVVLFAFVQIHTTLK